MQVPAMANNISMRGIFVTGIGTGVGKTAIAAGLTWAMRKRKVDVGIMKPFASANRAFSKKYRSKDTAILAEAAGVEDPDSELNPFFYSVAASPLLASQLKHEPAASIEKALQVLQKLAKKHDVMIVEGIGGIMVPLRESESVADFAKRAGMPAIIVTTPVIGTLNHTLLTVMACKEVGIDIKGIIVNKMPKRPSIAEQKAPEMIELLTGIKVLGTLPFSKSATHTTVGKMLEKVLDLDSLLSV
jgi:dethiobiotin synthetase